MKRRALALLLFSSLPGVWAYSAFVENDSYFTLCAEMDNINVPVWAPGATSYRVVATNPRYHPTSINEWGADWENCTFSSDRNLWIIGYQDGQYSEFRSSGFSDGDVYFAPDNPPEGTDEPFSQMPREINHDWMNNQYIRFTANEDNDVNIEVRIGAVLTVSFATISGQLDIEARALKTNGWISLGRRLFTSSSRTQSWNIPDHTWIEGVDSNVVHLRVVKQPEGGQSTPGSWAYYDYLQLRRRDERGDNSTYPMVLYTDLNTRVEAVWIDFWWRNPREMRITVLGGSSTPTSQYLRIKRRMPNSSDWNEIFVLYEDGNARIIPFPPAGIGAVPYGASVILGPTTNCPRPAIGINEVIVDPVNLRLRLLYETGDTADVALRAHRDGHYVDVLNLTYDTTHYALARFRSMWVYDGKSDIDHVANFQGVFPILYHWTHLEGTWWYFLKNVSSYHNTYCPEFFLELISTNVGIFFREAEHYSTVSGGVIQSGRTNAHGQQTLKFSTSGGTASYTFQLTNTFEEVYLTLRYSDAAAGDGIDTWGNLVRAIVDGTRTVDVYSTQTGDWNAFAYLPRIYLGTLSSGWHSLQLVVGAGTDGIELDSLLLTSQKIQSWVPRSLLTRQGEHYTWYTNATFCWRANAVGLQTMHMEHSGLQPALGFMITVATHSAHTYMRIRYSDDAAPNRIRVYVNNELRCQFPTLDTGTWTDFQNSPPLYLGALPAGTNLITITASLETFGVDIDEFEIYTYDNRSPVFTLPSSVSLPVGLSTSIAVSAIDPDGDAVQISSLARPQNAVFTNNTLIWTAQVDRCGTTNLAIFAANDGRGLTNSVSMASLAIVVPHDHDGDGLGDDWEWTHFAQYIYGGTDDPDGDGAANYQEFIAGTDPNSSSALFALKLEATNISSATCVIPVATQPGRRYTIFFTDDIRASTNWSAFSNPNVGVWVETNATPSVHYFVDDFTPNSSGYPPPAGLRYYRVKVEKIQ